VIERSPDALATVRRTDLDIAPVRVIHPREHGEARSDDPSTAFGDNGSAPNRLVTVRPRRRQVVGHDVVRLRRANVHVWRECGHVGIVTHEIEAVSSRAGPYGAPEIPKSFRQAEMVITPLVD
jgi:hypothetical protein